MDLNALLSSFCLLRLQSWLSAASRFALNEREMKRFPALEGPSGKPRSIQCLNLRRWTLERSCPCHFPLSALFSPVIGYLPPFSNIANPPKTAP